MSRRSWSWCWVAVLLLWLGPAGAAQARMIQIDLTKRRCLREAGQSWEQKTPNGRFKLHVEMKQTKDGDRVLPPYYEVKLLRGARPAWTQISQELVAESYTWLAPDGRFVALLRPGGKLELVNAEGVQVRRWDLSGYLSMAEKERLPKDLCEDLSWSRKARFTGDFFELEVPPTQALVDSRAPYSPTLLRLDLKAVSLVRDGLSLSGKDTELIQAFETAQDPEIRLELVDELLGRSQIREHLKSRELSAFWNKLLLTPEVTPKVLHRLAVEAVAAYGLDSEVRALTRMPGEFEERDVAVLDVLARRFPEDAGEYAVRVLDARHSVPAVRQRALQLLLGLQAARDMAVGFALRDPDLELRRLALAPLTEKPYTAARFEQVLGFCQDPSVYVQADVVRYAVRTLNNADSSTRKQFVDVLRRSEQGFSLGQCSELSLALGAFMDKEGNRTRALELYTRGLRGFEEQGKDAEALYPRLMVEAALQLALEAEKKGERAEAERYARKVLASARESPSECSPHPLRDEVPGLSNTCQAGRKPEKVAREVLQRLKSKPRGG